jgi:hypothetical protein
MTELDDLLQILDVPPTDPAADIARGETVLRRRHRLQVSAAAASVAVVAAAGLVLHGVQGSPGAGGGYADETGTPVVHATASPTASPTAEKAARTSRRHFATKAPTVQQRMRQLMQMDRDPRTTATLRGWRDVLAAHLDPGGSRLQLAQNVGGGMGNLSTKLDWDHGGMLQVDVATSWKSSDWNAYPPGPGQRITFRGHEARVLTDGADLYVAVEHDNGEVVMLTASPSFGNNGTSIPATGLTVAQLLDAAADPTLALPDPLPAGISGR